MKKNIKILAYYLPQFHEIPENNEWWGKGFTEWDNVKKAKSLFEGHNQPKIPLNKNYYDLSDKEVMRWQANLAKNYGLYGFCFYHYWFSGKLLLEKPLENFLADKSIDIPFCFCWANESWTNGWAKAECSVIMEQKYGGQEEWEQHFKYLLRFFKDERYIKEDNHPLLVIYRPYLCEEMTEMLNYWKKLARENGFSGLKIASQRFEDPNNNKSIYDYMDYHISYEPCTLTKKTGKIGLMRRTRQKIHDFILRKFNKDISISRKIAGPLQFDYDEVWKNILQKKPEDKKTIAGAFVNWDNTPRHSRRGTAFINVSPEKFEMYMKRQIRNIEDNFGNDYLFLFAWNEWGEGGVMEPDEVNEYAYLEALNRAVNTE